MNIVLVIFFSGIIINGILLMISLTPAGGTILGFTNSDLQYDNLKGYSNKTPDGFLSNTSQSQDASSFNPWLIVTNTGQSLLAGIASINLLLQALFMLESVFYNLGLWFPIFLPIFWGIATIFLGSKILLIGYAGSVLLNAILGRRS